MNIIGITILYAFWHLCDLLKYYQVHDTKPGSKGGKYRAVNLFINFPDRQFFFRLNKTSDNIYFTICMKIILYNFTTNEINK